MASTGMKILCLFWVLCPTMALVAKMKTCNDGVAVTHSSVYMKQGVHALLGMTDITNGEFFDTGENGTKDYCLKKGSNLTLSLTQTIDPHRFEVKNLSQKSVSIVVHADSGRGSLPVFLDVVCLDVCQSGCSICTQWSSFKECRGTPESVIPCPRSIVVEDAGKVPNPFFKLGQQLRPMMKGTIPRGLEDETIDMTELVHTYEKEGKLDHAMPHLVFNIPLNLPTNALPDVVKNMLQGKILTVLFDVSVYTPGTKEKDTIHLSELLHFRL